MSREKNQHQLHLLMESVGYQASTHPVLTISNSRAQTLEKFLSLTADEVDETKFEDDQRRIKSDLLHQNLKPSKAWMMEFVDVIVMLRAVRERIAPSFSVAQVIFPSTNGSKGSFDSIKNQISNINDGNKERNFELLFAELLALLKNVNVGLQAEIYTELMNAKLSANKEARFYKLEPGMSDAEILAKYEHVTATLRVLRNFLRKITGQDLILQPWITDFFKEEILGWRNSKLSMALLQQKILIFQQQIKDEMVWDTTVNLRDPFFETKMLIAGAKLINHKPKVEAQALQNSSANATLGQTIFWV